jgi:carbon-monoxide dehydrogenase medium subunit
MRLKSVEDALAGKPASADAVTAAARVPIDLAPVNADIHASADYRRAMVNVFAKRALERALGRSAR